MTVEDRRRNLKILAAASAAALTVIAVLIFLFFNSEQNRRHNEIVLPESRPEQEQAPAEDAAAEQGVLAVTAENVQQVIASMIRPQTFHQTMTVTRRSGTHTRTTIVDIWRSGGLTRAELADSFETKYLLTDGETVYVWYEDEEPAALSMQDGASYEDLAGLPTYEDVLRLPEGSIRAGGFLPDAQTGEGLLYVQAESEDTERQYWLSTDSGLLRRQSTTVDGIVVYEAEQTALETPGTGGDVAPAEKFQLPDGSSPF